MPDEFFDRSRRSHDSRPGKAEARILTSVQRVTRRWILPLIAAGALTVVALAVLGILVTRHPQYEPPATESAAGLTIPEGELEIEALFSPAKQEAISLERESNLLAPPPKPPEVSMPDLQIETLQQNLEPAKPFPELMKCEEPAPDSVLDGLDHADGGGLCIDLIETYVIGAEPGKRSLAPQQ